MSGIAGMLHLDGAPLDRGILAAMAGALEFRGPDAQHVWAEASVGFAHTLLKTTFEAEFEQQPASLDGQVWITADARIDARQDLARELGLPDAQLKRPDCELILHAYAKWGEACVEHLLGDFAFALWDGRERKLFCARDHFGVKPFYYAHVGDTFIFSNALNCVRLHPKVSDELNELAIADFLIFDFNQEPGTTTFQDIQRLPAAHVLVALQSGVTVRRYWSLPKGERIRYNSTRDYVEHFSSLLETTTVDRLRTKSVAISMSGGLDSASLAAFSRKASPGTDLHAHTIVYDWLLADEERRYAGIVAESLDIPIKYFAIDHVRPFENHADIEAQEPRHDPLCEITAGFSRRLSKECSVALTGNGADPLFCLSKLTNWKSIGEIPLFQTVTSFARYSWETGRIPKFRLRSTVLDYFRPSALPLKEVPMWLNTEFAQRCDVRSRVTRPQINNVPRPLSRTVLGSIFWSWQFELDDADSSAVRLESRHPYFDTRLVKYLLAIPELPYCMDKYLLRTALTGLLPESIRMRPKTPLSGDPLSASFSRYGFPPAIDSHPRIREFLNPAALQTCHTPGPYLWVSSRPLSLNIWLKSQEKLCKTTNAMKNRNAILPRNFVSTGPLRS